MPPLLVRRSFRIAICLVLITVPAGLLLPLQVHSDDPMAEWRTWANVAWRYFQSDVAWDSKTGLQYDAYGWHYFTEWGLASYVFSIVAAQDLGLMAGTPYGLEYRAKKVLDFVSNQSLSSGVPYVVYSSDNGQPVGKDVTNAADYGRLLIAMYLLKHSLLRNGYPSLGSRVDYIVNDYAKAALGLSSQLQNDFYSFYVAQGFKLWGVDVSSVEQKFEALQDGPFVSSSEMYGVEGIPSEVRVNPEVLLAGLLELNDVPAVASSPAWSVFREFADRVYRTQEARYASTGRLTAWAEGGVDTDPGFIYEWVVDPTGQSWTILDPQLELMWSQKNGPNQSYGKSIVNKLPVVFTKIAFGLHALYGTTYTRTLVDALYAQTSDSLGFREGPWEGGGVDGNRQVQTHDLVLSAAAYMNHISSSITTATSSHTETSSPRSSTSTSSQTIETSTTSTVTSDKIAEMASALVPIILILAAVALIWGLSARKKRGRPTP
jgi:hypothetical protein